MFRTLINSHSWLSRRGILPICVVAALVGAAHGALAQPPFPHLWLASGGAIGERSVIELRNAPVSSRCVFAYAAGITYWSRGRILAPPIQPIAATTTNAAGAATVHFGIPNIPALVGHLIHVQAGGVTTSLWLTHDTLWPIAAPATPRFVDRRIPAPIDSGASPVASGHLLVVGGSTSTLARTKDAYLLTPAVGLFRRVGSMSVARSDALVLPFDDGSALVVGGEPSGRTTLERFDPHTLTFTSVATVSTIYSSDGVVARDHQRRDYGVFTCLPYDRLFVYDPRQRTVATCRLTKRRGLPALAPTYGGVLVFGGADIGGYAHADVDYVDLASLRSFPFGRLARRRVHGSAHPLTPTEFLLAGGYEKPNEPGTAVLQLEVFDALRQRGLPLPHRLHYRSSSPVVIPRADGSLVVGGEPFFSRITSADVAPMRQPPWFNYRPVVPYHGGAIALANGSLWELH